jgi:hypothetical protein
MISIFQSPNIHEEKTQITPKQIVQKGTTNERKGLENDMHIKS